MDVIIDAKERQAAEANKNATILLQELDLEKVIIFSSLFYLSRSPLPKLHPSLSPPSPLLITYLFISDVVHCDCEVYRI